MSALPVITGSTLPACAAELTAKAADYVTQAQSKNTRAAYASAWRVLDAECLARVALALPATLEHCSPSSSTPWAP